MCVCVCVCVRVSRFQIIIENEYNSHACLTSNEENQRKEFVKLNFKKTVLLDILQVKCKKDVSSKSYTDINTNM